MLAVVRMSNIGSVLKRIWGSDKGTGFKIATWGGALLAWQLLDRDNSIIWSRYNQWKYQQALEKSEAAVAKGKELTKATKKKISAEINRLEEQSNDR